MNKQGEKGSVQWFENRQYDAATTCALLLSIKYLNERYGNFA